LPEIDKSGCPEEEDTIFPEPIIAHMLRGEYLHLGTLLYLCSSFAAPQFESAL